MILYLRERKIAWDDVEKYLRKYVGEVYSIAEDKEIVFIGTELPGGICRICLHEKN